MFLAVRRGGCNKWQSQVASRASRKRRVARKRAPISETRIMSACHVAPPLPQHSMKGLAESDLDYDRHRIRPREPR